MHSVSIEGILIGVGITLLGVIVGGFIGYYFSWKVAAEQIRSMAGAKLRAAFAPEIADYYLLDSQMRELDLRLAVHRHASAIEEYRVFVPCESQTGYQKAWECYYEPFRGQDVIYTDRKEVYRERVEAILKFTKPN